MDSDDEHVTRADLVRSFNCFIKQLDAHLKEDKDILNDEQCVTAVIVTELFHDIEDATIDLKESY